MELQQIHYFLAVAKERHFTKAADSVHVSQPTLSEQILNLEKELGTPLFERVPRNVKLTEAGERFLSYAQLIFDSVEKAKVDISAFTGDLTGRVSLAAIPTIGPYLLPPILKELRKKAPNLKLELFELTTSSLIDYLKDGRIDMGILALPIEETGIATRSIKKEPFFLAAPATHPLAKKRFVTKKDIKNERLLMLQEGHCFRDQSLEYCELEESDPQVVFQGSSLTSVMRLTQAGEGITFVPEMAVQKGEFSHLKFIPFKSPAPFREIGLIWRMTTPLNKAQELLIDIIEQKSK